MGLRKLLYRLLARRGRAKRMPAVPAMAVLRPDPGAPCAPVARAAGSQVRFRPQISCDSRQVASVLVVPPRHLDGDADAILRDALRLSRDWAAGGISLPPLAIELPRLIAESAQLAQPLIWEIDRQDIAPDQVIFSAPSLGQYSQPLEGMALLSRLGCGIELDCLDPKGMAVIRELKPHRARMRVPPAFLPDDFRAPGDGQHILSLLALAERHGLATLVDDVRSRAEFDYLAQLGFCVAQGDAVAPVLDSNALGQFLSHTQTHRPTPDLLRWPAA